MTHLRSDLGPAEQPSLWPPHRNYPCRFVLWLEPVRPLLILAELVMQTSAADNSFGLKFTSTLRETLYFRVCRFLQNTTTQSFSQLAEKHLVCLSEVRSLISPLCWLNLQSNQMRRTSPQRSTSYVFFYKIGKEIRKKKQFLTWNLKNCYINTF